MPNGTCFAVAGLRVGTQFTIPDSGPNAVGGVRIVTSGKISANDQVALQYLCESGYTLIECDGVPEFDELASTFRERTAERIVSKDANAERARNAQGQAEEQRGVPA